MIRQPKVLILPFFGMFLSILAVICELRCALQHVAHSRQPISLYIAKLTAYRLVLRKPTMYGLPR